MIIKFLTHVLVKKNKKIEMNCGKNSLSIILKEYEAEQRKRTQFKHDFIHEILQFYKNRRVKKRKKNTRTRSMLPVSLSAL